MTSPEHLAAALSDELRALRRELHAHPEIGLDNPWTQGRILEALADLDLEITRGSALTSITAVLRGRAPYDGVRPVVLLRADTDALPVTEEVDTPYRSTIPGVMHACGHDLHVAGLVGAAKILHALREDLIPDVVLMFQPGEEGPGGAEVMVREGLLEVAGRRVDAAYAIHVIAAEEPHGVWYGRPGPTMAGADEVTITLTGRGGHGSAPHRALDPVPAACALVLDLQTMVTRRFHIFDPVVVTVGSITAGTKHNIIGDSATLLATIRTFSEASRSLAHDEVEQVVRGIAQAHGLTARLDWGEGYPVTINDDAEFAFAREVLVDTFGSARWADMAFPEAGSEDMSFVLREVPGAYLYISATPPGQDPRTAEDNHSPRATFDDAVVPDMARAFAEMALRRFRS